MLAGPVEATALGNVLVQARPLGADVDLDDLRACRPHPRAGRFAPGEPTAGAAAARGAAMRVALLVTCVNDAMFPDTGRPSCAAAALGVEVDFPEAQTCCGQPMVNTGYLDEAVPVVRTFVDAFAGYDAIVTPSGRAPARPGTSTRSSAARR